ncbi:hypothetical protein D3C86_2169360 [compost metagenome]
MKVRVAAISNIARCDVEGMAATSASWACANSVMRKSAGFRPSIWVSLRLFSNCVTSRSSVHAAR